MPSQNAGPDPNKDRPQFEKNGSGIDWMTVLGGVLGGLVPFGGVLSGLFGGGGSGGGSASDFLTPMRRIEEQATKTAFQGQLKDAQAIDRMTPRADAYQADQRLASAQYQASDMAANAAAGQGASSVGNVPMGAMQRVASAAANAGGQIAGQRAQIAQNITQGVAGQNQLSMQNHDLMGNRSGEVLYQQDALRTAQMSQQMQGGGPGSIGGVNLMDVLTNILGFGTGFKNLGSLLKTNEASITAKGGKQ